MANESTAVKIFVFSLMSSLSPMNLNPGSAACSKQSHGKVHVSTQSLRQCCYHDSWMNKRLDGSYPQFWMKN